MTPLQRVTIVVDVGDGDFENIGGYLVTDTHAAFIYADKVNVSLVARTPLERLYVEKGPSVSLGKTSRGDMAIIETIEELRRMSALDFVLYHVLPDREIEEIKFIRE